MNPRCVGKDGEKGCGRFLEYMSGFSGKDSKGNKDKVWPNGYSAFYWCPNCCIAYEKEEVVK